MLIKKIKNHFLFGFLILSFLLSATAVQAQEEINKFGIHILEPNELAAAAKLVNSQGGDWGFVTIVIRDDDLDFKKWQDFFDQCRRLHLIPLVRLATHIENNSWRAPEEKEAKMWADFLDRLNWPVKKRYLILFNEPNHAKEWGGKVAPDQYGRIVNAFAKELKKKNENFFLLPAGLDLAANNSRETMDAFLFLKKAHQANPEIFNQLDGWASHSYPNHGFVGKPTDTGRTSIRGYQWELSVLKRYFGLKKDLPVFITETGWPHQEPKNNPPASGKRAKNNFYDPKTTAQYIEKAYENVWLPDKRVVAVTPFTLNYHTPPLDNFSWLDKDGHPYPQYETIKEIPKKSWWPEQETSWQVVSIKIPQFLPINSQYQGKIKLKNTGQSIWGEKSFLIKPLSSTTPWLELPPGKLIFPGQSYEFSFNIATSPFPQTFNLSWEKIGNFSITAFNPASIKSYNKNAFQKILSLIKVWWYDKKRQWLK